MEADELALCALVHVAETDEVTVIHAHPVDAVGEEASVHGVVQDERAVGNDLLGLCEEDLLGVVQWLVIRVCLRRLAAVVSEGRVNALRPVAIIELLGLDFVELRLSELVVHACKVELGHEVDHEECGGDDGEHDVSADLRLGLAEVGGHDPAGESEGPFKPERSQGHSRESRDRREPHGVGVPETRDDVAVLVLM